MFFQFVEQLNRQCAGKGIFFMPFAPAHIEKLHVTQPDIVAASKHIDIYKTVINQAAIGPSITGFFNLQPVVCFGFVPIWDGVAEAWMIADDKARTKPLWITKSAKRFFDIAQISYNLHRIQISVRTADKRAHKWALCLGFQEEGRMRGYGPDGADHYIMARYK
jgi:hypothetical protein